MTGLDRTQTPKTRPMPHKRSALVASLDIGTSKIACMIARLKPCAPNEALRGPHPCGRADRLQPDPVARHEGRRGGRSRRMRAGGAPGRGAGRANGQGPGRIRAAVGLGRAAAGPADRSRRRHPRRRGDAGRRQPRHLHRHAPRHRRGPHRAACAAGRLFARRRQGHPRSPRHGRAPVRRRHERRHLARRPSRKT